MWLCHVGFLGFLVVAWFGESVQTWAWQAVLLIVNARLCWCVPSMRNA